MEKKQAHLLEFSATAVMSLFNIKFRNDGQHAAKNQKHMFHKFFKENAIFCIFPFFNKVGKKIKKNASLLRHEKLHFTNFEQVNQYIM